MNINSELLQSIYEIPKARADKWSPFLVQACKQYDITTQQRISAFLAQIGHESVRLAFTHEIWNPEHCPWQKHYEMNANLGNTEKGDGERFKGRGLIQITGRYNYMKASKALGVDFVNEPELLEQPIHAANSAAWFWSKHGLNELADANDFDEITKKINGGLTGSEDRHLLWEKATALV